MSELVSFDLKGDFHRDIRGAKLRLLPREAGAASGQGHMDSFASLQAGDAGDITAGLPPRDYVGHPYVDVWQAVKPARLGVDAWPVVPRSVEWKKGVCAAFGWPHAEQADIARAWQHILSKVSTWTDLEPAFLGRVEELIDFVTAP